MANRNDLSALPSCVARMQGLASGRPLLVAALLALGASGCGDEDAAEAQTNLDVWRSRGPASYTYVVDHVCFCSGVEPVRVVVEDGVATRATGLNTAASREDRRVTMTDLLEEILRIIRQKPDHFRAEYDPELGYLLEARVDYLDNAIDDELSIEVSCFERDTGDDACPTTRGQN